MRFLAATIAFFVLTSGLAAEPVPVGKVRVLDGDTVAISIRLLGFDTPETSKLRAKCDKEIELGKRAATRLREILATGKPTVELAPCSCPENTQGTERCNFGRACGRLFVNGKDVGEMLIAEGHARPYDFKWDARPPAADWCS